MCAAMRSRDAGRDAEDGKEKGASRKKCRHLFYLEKNTQQLFNNNNMQLYACFK